jgi:hypothetical protein
MKAKLIKVLDQYHLYNGDKVIATTIVGNPMLLPNLSKQNCDEIFGVVDVEKLADEITKEYATLTPKAFKRGVLLGFNKAMELNKDKVFALKDMISFGRWIISNQEFENTSSWSKDTAMYQLNNWKHLQQPTEIKVEIDMQCLDPTCDGINRKGICIPGDKPKLDSQGCLILKKI